MFIAILYEVLKVLFVVAIVMFFVSAMLSNR